MLCKHPEETAAALRRVREEAECVKLGGQSKIDSVYLPKQRYMFDVVVALVMRRHTECSHIYIYYIYSICLWYSKPSNLFPTRNAKLQKSSTTCPPHLNIVRAILQSKAQKDGDNLSKDGSEGTLPSMVFYMPPKM